MIPYMCISHIYDIVLIYIPKYIYVNLHYSQIWYL